MPNRIPAWVTLACLLFFSWSCMFLKKWAKEPLESIKPEKREGMKVSAVQTKSGEKIKFNKNPIAKIQGNSVVGEMFVQNIAIEKSKIENQESLTSATISLLMTSEGKSYKVMSWTYASPTYDKIIIRSGYTPFSIPLQDIDLVWIRKANIPVNILLNLAIFVGVWNLIGPDFYGSPH